MTAPVRRRDAVTSRAFAHTATAQPHDVWHRAVEFRRAWLGRALATEPADRDRAEHGLARIYARTRRRRPRFEWVESPAKALPLVGHLPTLDDLYRQVRDVRQPVGPHPLSSDLAVAVSRLRDALSSGVAHPDPEHTPARMGKKKEPWPDGPPLDSLAAGVPLGVVLHRGLRNALHTSLVAGFVNPVRRALGPATPLCWFGQQDAFWIGYYDALRGLGLARYASDAAEHLDDWVALAGSAGWWWPGEDVCVVVERPERVRTEPVPGGWHGEVRLTPGGVRYRDGWNPPG